MKKKNIKSIDSLCWSSSTNLSEIGIIDCPDNMLDMSVVETYTDSETQDDYDYLNYEGFYFLLRICSYRGKEYITDFATDIASNGFAISFLKPM